MVSIIRKKNSLKIEEIWFSKRKNNNNKVDIISYCQTPNKFAYLDRSARTLINDLTQDKEKLLNSIHKDYQYEIRKAEREGVITSVFFSSDISTKMIDEFSCSYLQFMKGKNLHYSGSKETFSSYLKLFCQSGNLAISTAKITDKILVYHVYIYDSNVTRLMYSISHYRTDLMISKSLVGMSNRLLHYNDMLTFKDTGLKEYDWGGISDETEVKNILEFKSKFGGVERDTFYVQEAVSFKGKIALMAKRILKVRESRIKAGNKNAK